MNEWKHILSWNTEAAWLLHNKDNTERDWLSFEEVVVERVHVHICSSRCSSQETSPLPEHSNDFVRLRHSQYTSQCTTTIHSHSIQHFFMYTDKVRVNTGKAPQRASNRNCMKLRDHNINQYVLHWLLRLESLGTAHSITTVTSNNDQIDVYKPR